MQSFITSLEPFRKPNSKTEVMATQMNNDHACPGNTHTNPSSILIPQAVARAAPPQSRAPLPLQRSGCVWRCPPQVYRLLRFYPAPEEGSLGLAPWECPQLQSLSSHIHCTITGWLCVLRPLLPPPDWEDRMASVPSPFPGPGRASQLFWLNEQTNDQILNQLVKSLRYSINLLFLSGEEKQATCISLKTPPIPKTW